MTALADVKAALRVTHDEDDCPDDAAEIAEREGWAAKAHESAPENNGAAPKRRTKNQASETK